MIKLVAAVFSATALLLPLAHADDAHHKKDKAASGATQASSAMADGEIRKVDKDAKKLTIKHGPLQSLDMPAMTMVFQVKDPAMLEQVKVGGAFTVTKIEPAQRSARRCRDAARPA